MGRIRPNSAKQLSKSTQIGCTSRKFDRDRHQAWPESAPTSWTSAPIWPDSAQFRPNWPARWGAARAPIGRGATKSRFFARRCSPKARCVAVRIWTRSAAMPSRSTGWVGGPEARPPRQHPRLMKRIIAIIRAPGQSSSRENPVDRNSGQPPLNPPMDIVQRGTPKSTQAITHTHNSTLLFGKLLGRARDYAAAQAPRCADHQQACKRYGSRSNAGTILENPVP